MQHQYTGGVWAMPVEEERDVIYCQTEACVKETARTVMKAEFLLD
jgi:hypothetical protein